MKSQKQPAARTAPLFRPTISADLNPIPSSSPGFGTPVHPIRPSTTANATAKPTILPVILPAPTLRPIAFRTFTKKHNLTITSSALQSLATFIGKYCGAGWREEGLAEHVLEEVARTWKKGGGGVIVDGEAESLIQIMKSLETCMSGGRIVQGSNLSRQGSFSFGVGEDPKINGLLERSGVSREDSQSSLGLSGLEVEDDETEEEGMRDPRRWLKVISAFDQPRLVYNVGKKHFERATTKPTIFPPPSHKTHLFRHRYSLIHQRLLRNEAFQKSSFVPARVPTLHRSSSTLTTTQQSYKITPIANLLGRGGSSHLVLGLLTISPTGTLAIGDLTGSIALDLQHAKPVPEDGAWFCPGMIVLVDGVYEEEYNSAAGALGGGGGVGGTIGGKFIGFSIGGPPCERREVTLGVGSSGGTGDTTTGGGFGWVDFLGVGSERALGAKMRRIEQRVLGRGNGDDSQSSGRGRIAILSEVNLDSPRTLDALRKVLGIYEAEDVENLPMAVVIMGNFVRHAVMAGGGSGGSIEYKEYFDALANTLSDYPSLLANTTFVFAPGDNDPWASASAAGAATTLPRKGIPELFTTRIKRTFAAANAEADKNGPRTGPPGEAIWTTNPVRISIFGPTQEIVLFRDDILGRLRRTAIRFRPSVPEDSQSTEAGPDGEGADIPPATEANPEATEAMDLDPTTAAPPTKTPPKQATITPPSLHTSRKLTKTLLDQAHLSPFPLSVRPLAWDHASALSLYPLPTALVLADREADAFVVRYEGCVVVNPGCLVVGEVGRVGRWVEVVCDGRGGRGVVREVGF